MAILTTATLLIAVAALVISIKAVADASVARDMAEECRKDLDADLEQYATRADRVEESLKKAQKAIYNNGCDIRKTSHDLNSLADVTQRILNIIKGEGGADA